MHLLVHQIAIFLVRIFIMWLRVLGTSWGGIVAQLLVPLLSGFHGAWRRVQAWKTSWKRGLQQSVYALLVVWAVFFVYATGATIRQERSDLASRLQRTLGEGRALQRQVAILNSQLDQENNEITDLKSRI